MTATQEAPTEELQLKPILLSDAELEKLMAKLDRAVGVGKGVILGKRETLGLAALIVLTMDK